MKRHDGIAWLLMDLMADAGYNFQHEASFIFRDCVSDNVVHRWQEATTGRKGNFISPDIYFVRGEGARPTLADFKCMEEPRTPRTALRSVAWLPPSRPASRRSTPTGHTCWT